MEVLTKLTADPVMDANREGLPAAVPPTDAIRETPAGETLAPPIVSGGHNRKITFARLATCILNVERARKKSVSKCRAREEELLSAAETGDVARLKQLIASASDLNIDYTDQLGRTPLHLAVVNEHKEVVRLLLDHVDRRRVYQALLSAINLGNEEIAELIIEHPKYSEISSDLKLHGKAFFYQNKFNDDNQFSEEITPLILASQQNRFEVVMALLLKKETIEKPHKCHCACADCLAHARRDELKFARSRLNAYRALSSEAYISLSSDDPILTSFQLRKELQQVAKEEKYYTAEYSALAGRLSDYTVKLLDKVHGNEELNAILNATDDSDNEVGGELARLQLAINYKEKKFVAHPSCQKKLTTLWYRDFYKLLKTRSALLQTLVIGLVVLFYPMLSCVYIVAPGSVVGRMMSTPCIKFVAQATSYMFFLFLIVVHGQVEQGKLCRERISDHEAVRKNFFHFKDNFTSDLQDFDKMCIRNYTTAVMEVCILLWISGMLWDACKQVYRIGGHGYFINIYNALDFFMLAFYMASFTLKRLTERIVRSSLSYFNAQSSWEKLLEDSPEANYRLYWLNADRFYWDAWDPVYVCEALFAIGNILNFARLFHLLAINEHLGPMLISLERMIKDVMKFMVTFVPIFLAFMVGMYNLYWYYDPSVRKAVEITDHKTKTNAQEGFGNLEYTFRTIFWALFGLKDAKTVELQGFKSRFTESVGYIVFGVYNWGAVIVLLNMLIAMMTRSFDKIATDQDIEWKFVRSKLYMEYIRHGSTLPVPFNILPTPKSIARLLRSALSACSLWRSGRTNAKSMATLEENPFIFTMNGGNTAVRLSQHNLSHSEVEPNAEQGDVSSSALPPAASAAASGADSQTLGYRHSFLIPKPSCETSLPESQSVIKSVVRRYIFERLLASVVPNEGANDTDCLKQQTAAIQDDLHFIKPKMFEQFATISKEFISLQRTMVHIKGQLNDIAHSVSVLCTAPADGAIPPIQISPLGESDQPSPPGYREVVTPSSSDVSYYLRGDPPSSAFTGTDPPAPPTTTSTTSRRLGTFVRTPLLNFLDRQRASHAQQGSLTGEPEFTFTF